MPPIARTTSFFRRASLQLIVVAMAASFAISAPAHAQEGTALQAPAIGPWLGAPRGTIDSTLAIEDGVSVRATVVDADSPRPIPYRISVDGRIVATGESSRPTGVGEPVDVTVDVDAAPGRHRVCLQVSDVRFRPRTVDCADAITAPPETVAQDVLDAARGAVVAPSGVVVPVVGGRPGNWRVTTPCGATTRLSDGEYVDRVRVVVDAGHGGSESGATGPGILEKHLNLEVANLVVEKLEALGISAQTTRNWDYRVPIRTRAEIASALAPDVFLSVHHNGGALRPSSRPGTEVFYATDQPEARRLARILYEDMVGVLSRYDAAWVSTVNEGASVRLREDGMDLYGIHRYSPDITSVITEFVYLSNPSEARLMARPELPDVEAQVIVDSLLRWWFSDDAGTTRGNVFVDESSSGTGGFDGCVDPPLTGPDRSLSTDHPADSPSTSRADTLVASLGTTPTEALSEIRLLPALTLRTDPAIG